MDMAQASAGLQAGISENETLIIFKSPKGLAQFIDKGWEYGGGGGAGGRGRQVRRRSGGRHPEAQYYTLTKNGLQVGVALEGTKFWKDKALN